MNIYVSFHRSDSFPLLTAWIFTVIMVKNSFRFWSSVFKFQNSTFDVRVGRHHRLVFSSSSSLLIVVDGEDDLLMEQP
jgi:hypothetical protein